MLKLTVRQFYSNCHPLNAASFDVVPNPAVNQITISSSNKNLIYGIKILDNYGNTRKVFKYKTGVSSARILLDDLNPGFYLASVFDGHQWSSKQFIIQK